MWAERRVRRACSFAVVALVDGCEYVADVELLRGYRLLNVGLLRRLLPFEYPETMLLATFCNDLLESFGRCAFALGAFSNLAACSAPKFIRH